MIVDNEKILAELKVQYDSYNSIVIPLYSDIKKHRLNNRLSLLYIYILDTKKTFIILANHSDKLFNVDSLSFLNNDRIKYTYSTEIKNAVNIDALYYMSNLCNINKEELYTDSHTFFYNKYWKLDNVNDIIPVLKHIEYYDKIKDKILKVIDNENKIGFNEYNNKVIEFFKSKNKEILIINLPENDDVTNWKLILNYLEIYDSELVNEPFPHLNKQ